MENSEKEKVRVSFRLDSDGELTAVFVDKHYDLYYECYAHIGQHSMCSPDWIRETTVAKDYTDLMAELESIGYEVKPVARMKL